MSLQVTVLKRNVRECFVHPPFSRQDQLSVKWFLKYAVCASYYLRAGISETEVFLPVLTILPQAAAVPSVLLLTNALALSTCCEGGIAFLCPKAAGSVPHALSHQLWAHGDRELQAAGEKEVARLVGGPEGSDMRTEFLPAPWAWGQLGLLVLLLPPPGTRPQ